HISGDIQEIVPKKLWRLGEFRHMDRVAPIWLARRLSQGDSFDEIYDALAGLKQDREGLILCCSRPFSKRVTFSGDYQLVDSVSLLNDQGYLSTESLAAYIQPKNQREDTLVYWDENRGLLYLRGKEPIQFTGTMNRRAIGLLYERCLETENKWNSQALLRRLVQTPLTSVSCFVATHSGGK
nr:hypothetical protein [Endozoicomonas sp.]